MLKFMWKLGERMNVLSKKHSSELIRDLNLNRVPEILLDSYDEMKIGDFCDKYNEPIYILRDLESPNGMFFVCKSKEAMKMPWYKEARSRKYQLVGIENGN